MMYPRAFVLSLAVSLGQLLIAQVNTADDYFNLASRQFVKEDNRQALRTLDQGLRQFPTDPKLLKLAEELVKQNKKDPQEQQQQEQQQQEEQQQDQQKQQGGQNEQQQQREEQEQQGQEEQPQQAEEKGQEQRGGKPHPGTIDPQAAMRMLDAMERNEKDVQEKVRVKRRPAVRRTIEKDW
jgi:Ca-activated chloride channel homolog